MPSLGSLFTCSRNERATGVRGVCMSSRVGLPHRVGMGAICLLYQGSDTLIVAISVCDGVSCVQVMLPTLRQGGSTCLCWMCVVRLRMLLSGMPPSTGCSVLTPSKRPAEHVCNQAGSAAFCDLVNSGISSDTIGWQPQQLQQTTKPVLLLCGNNIVLLPTSFDIIRARPRCRPAVDRPAVDRPQDP